MVFFVLAIQRVNRSGGCFVSICRGISIFMGLLVFLFFLSFTIFFSTKYAYEVSDIYLVLMTLSKYFFYRSTDQAEFYARRVSQSQKFSD